MGQPALVCTTAVHRILVVEDYKDSADMMCTILGVLGHRTCAVHSGHAALEAAAQFDPTLVILDLGLPDMSGLDVARELRLRRPGPGLYIVAVSGWSRPYHRDAALAAGCNQYIVKPARVAALRSIMADAGAPADWHGWAN
jgi:CheY-like chemotaxis protein